MHIFLACMPIYILCEKQTNKQKMQMFINLGKYKPRMKIYNKHIRVTHDKEKFSLSGRGGDSTNLMIFELRLCYVQMLIN